MVASNVVATRATRGAHGAGAIVVGTDFSRIAGNAVARALQIAAANEGILHIVHASRTLPRALARTFGVADHAPRLRLAEAVQEARSAGVSAKSHQVDAGAMRGLSKSIRELRPALVVVGARGRAMRDAYVGSTAERLAFLGGRPVLLVRRPANRPYHEVVIAADPDSEVEQARNAAHLVAAEVPCSVVHAYEGTFEYRLTLDGAGTADLRKYRAQARQEARAAMTTRLRDAGVDPKLLQLRHGSAPRVLQGVKANALLVINRGRSLARHLMLGSTTRFVIAHGRSDVLIV